MHALSSQRSLGAAIHVNKGSKSYEISQCYATSTTKEKTIQCFFYDYFIKFLAISSPGYFCSIECIKNSRAVNLFEIETYD